MLECSLSGFCLQEAYSTVYEAEYTRVMHNLRRTKEHHVRWYGSVVKQLIIFPYSKEGIFFHPFEDFYPIYSRFAEYVVWFISWFLKKNILQFTFLKMDRAQVCYIAFNNSIILKVNKYS